VLYWTGRIFAYLFIPIGGVVAVNAPDPAIKWIVGGGFIVVGVVAWLVGRACRDVLPRRKRRAPKRSDLIERSRDFDELSDAEKIEARLYWLEWKMVEVLWALISIVSMVAGALVAWFISEIMGNRSLWLLFPVWLFTWMIVGWRLQRQIFRGAPPHIDFIDF